MFQLQGADTLVLITFTYQGPRPNIAIWYLWVLRLFWGELSYLDQMDWDTV